MSMFMKLYDKGRGTRKGPAIIGTNLGGGKPWSVPWMKDFSSGVFAWSGDPAEHWNEMICALARDCCFRIGPSLSIMNNKEVDGLMACADIDAQVCDRWTREECQNLALHVVTRAYMLTCPSLVNEENPRPIFVYTEPAETVCKYISCCEICDSGVSLDDDGMATCGRCKTKVNVVDKPSYKVGFHLNGVQTRDPEGRVLDPEKSGAILRTSQHLFVRKIMISLWSQYGSVDPNITFDVNGPDCVDQTVVVDGHLEGKMNVKDGKATVVFPWRTRLEGGVHHIRDECGEHEFEVEAHMPPYRIPRFPGAMTAEKFIDESILGSTTSAYNGCMRCPFVPKVNKNCLCANDKMADLKECFLCGRSEKRNTAVYRVPDNTRRYIPLMYIMSDLTTRPLGEFDRFQWQVHQAGAGYVVGETVVVDLKKLTGEEITASNVAVRVDEVRDDGSIVKVSCMTSMYDLEYQFKDARKEKQFVGVVEDFAGKGATFYVVDNRITQMRDILRQTCGYLPTGTQRTEFVIPEKFEQLNQNLTYADTEDFSKQCDAAMGLTLPDKKKTGGYSELTVAIPYEESEVSRKMVVYNQGETIRNRDDPRYIKMREILFRYWGEKNNKYGIYNEKTTFSITMTTTEPKWGRSTIRASTRYEVLKKFYWMRILNDTRCRNALYCAKHPTLKRRPFRWTKKTAETKDTTGYCMECDPEAYGRHRGQATPVFMKIDVDNGKPRVTLGCHAEKKGYMDDYSKCCKFSKEKERRKACKENNSPDSRRTFTHGTNCGRRM